MEGNRKKKLSHKYGGQLPSSTQPWGEVVPYKSWAGVALKFKLFLSILSSASSVSCTAVTNG